jgi:hypothetical protein
MGVKNGRNGRSFNGKKETQQQMKSVGGRLSTGWLECYPEQRENVQRKEREGKKE